MNSLLDKLNKWLEHTFVQYKVGTATVRPQHPFKPFIKKPYVFRDARYYRALQAYKAGDYSVR